jgi:hypothetical protein
MAGFTSHGDIDPAKLHWSTWRKTMTAGVASQMYDDSMLPGFPPPNYYASAPLEAATLDANRGIRHWGADGGNFSEHLLETGHFTASGTGEGPITMFLNDVVMYYPFIETGTTDVQEMVNDITLPRYQTGAGLRAYMVAQSVASTTCLFTMSYTNQDGVSGRTSQPHRTTTPTASGQVMTSTDGTATRFTPWIPLQSGDSGIRSIESVTVSSVADGLAAIVLVRPIASWLQAQSGVGSETPHYPRLPKIEQGAYLSLLRLPNGSVTAGRISSGYITTIRS